MLGKTANGIFWMYRYLERAENTARLLEAGFRMALTRGVEEASEEWRSVIVTLGHRPAYEAGHGDYTGAQVCNFVLRDKSNPQSLSRLMDAARLNARTCRADITGEVWEALNDGWLALADLLARPVRESDLGAVLQSIRNSATLVRGATYGSMLRNEIYYFARAGTYVERADNTARILDVKYYLLLPSLALVGSRLDTSQWEHVLRCLSAERAYNWLNAGRLSPLGITEFLVLDDRFPRSLIFCYDALMRNLAELARLHNGEGVAMARMRKASARLADLTIEAISEQGLHEFLVEFTAENRAIADAIAKDYLFSA